MCHCKRWGEMPELASLSGVHLHSNLTSLLASIDFTFPLKLRGMTTALATFPIDLFTLTEATCFTCPAASSQTSFLILIPLPKDCLNSGERINKSTQNIAHNAPTPMTSHDPRGRNASPQFRSIKAVFEHIEAPAPRPFTRTSKPASPANEAPNPVASLISRETITHQQDNIDALLEAPSARIWAKTPEQQLRHKASWVGPPPPLHLLPSRGSDAAMAHKVTVTYSSPGLQPPVYITASLSEPQWELLEMDCRRTPNGEQEFAKTFHVPKGEYQYKFRLGPGDWWVCDESKPTVADGFGARNNVLVVKDDGTAKEHAAEQQSSVADGAVFDSPTHGSHMTNPVKKHDSLGYDVIRDSQAHVPELMEDHHDEGQDNHHAPLFAHEQLQHPGTKLGVPPEKVPVTFSRQDTLSLGDDDNDDDGDVEPSHSSEAPILQSATQTDVERTPTPSLDEDEDPMEEAPLMRHETLSPSDDAPLMKHETLSPIQSPHTPFASHEAKDSGKHILELTASPTSSHSSAHLPGPDSHVPAEADPNDPSLIKFPTHHEGIISSLRRASLRMADDETKDDILPSSSPITQSVSHSSQSPSLPSVREDEEDLADEPDEGPRQVSKLPGSSERPAALITPPGTPDESKTPRDSTAHPSDHHHTPLAEKDMQEESEHDVKHHDEQETESEKKESKPKSKSKQKAVSRDAGESSAKSSMFETVLGLSLFVVVGAGAAWLAFMMQDPIKDGGAALTGAS